MIIKWIRNKIKKYKDIQLQMKAMNMADTIVKDEFVEQYPEYRWMRYNRHYQYSLSTRIDKEKRLELTNEFYRKMKKNKKM